MLNKQLRAKLISPNSHTEELFDVEIRVACGKNYKRFCDVIRKHEVFYCICRVPAPVANAPLRPARTILGGWTWIGGWVSADGGLRFFRQRIDYKKAGVFTSLKERPIPGSSRVISRRG